MSYILRFTGVRPKLGRQNMNLEEKVKKVVEDFNRRFAAECEVLKADEHEIVIHFKGHICFTCGTYDYFEDLAYDLSDALGKNYIPAEYEQLEDGTYIVKYKPEDEVDSIKREITVILYDNVEKLRIEIPKRKESLEARPSN